MKFQGATTHMKASPAKIKHEKKNFENDSTLEEVTV